MSPSHPLDQDIQVNQAELTYIDELFDDAVQSNSPDILFDYLVAVKQQFQIKGLALCKTFYLLDKNWNVFMIGDNCLDTISFHTGFSRHTVERYIKVWKALLSAPKHLVTELEQKSVNVLIPVANAIAQGEEITEHTWDRVVDAPDENSVRKLLNEELDREERSNKLSLYMDRQGSLWATTKDKRKFIGSLEVDDDEDIVRAAIERITRRSGVMK